VTALLTGQIVLACSSNLEAIGLSIILKQALRCRNVALARDYGELRAVLSPLTAMAVIVDHLRGNLVEAITTVRSLYPDTKLVVLSSEYGFEVVRPLVTAGLHGFIPKNLDRASLVEALRMIALGNIYMPAEIWRSAFQTDLSAAAPSGKPFAPLSVRQRQVLDLASEGKSNKEIARQLDIAEATVKVHLSSAFRVMGVTSRGRAAAILRQYDAA
jgi:DNA-binding NarL/FixJ family response regulator